MSLTASTISKALKQQGYPVTLYKGKGYFYFEWDSLEADGRYDTQSVMVNTMNQLTREQWMSEATSFVYKMQRH